MITPVLKCSCFSRTHTQIKLQSQTSGIISQITARTQARTQARTHSHTHRECGCFLFGSWSDDEPSSRYWLTLTKKFRSRRQGDCCVSWHHHRHSHVHHCSHKHTFTKTGESIKAQAVFCFVCLFVCCCCFFIIWNTAALLPRFINCLKQKIEQSEKELWKRKSGVRDRERKKSDGQSENVVWFFFFLRIKVVQVTWRDTEEWSVITGLNPSCSKTWELKIRLMNTVNFCLNGLNGCLSFYICSTLPSSWDWLFLPHNSESMKWEDTNC